MRVFLFIFLMCVFFRARDLQAEKQILAPDFKLNDLSKNSVTLSEYRDKQGVVLFFWTTWCPFCLRELRTLNNRYLQLLKNDWELLAINVAEPAYRVESYVKRYSLVFKVLLDRAAKAADSFGIMGVPTYIMIDKKGQIIFRDNYFPEEKYKELTSK